MANGHGGARIGAGRKKKPLADKLLEGNPGKRRPKVLEFKGPERAVSTEPPEYLSEYTRNAVSPSIEEIYRETAEWLESTGCLRLVNSGLIAQYAMLKTRWLECERVAATTIMFKETRDDGTFILIPNQICDLGMRYLKAADAIWDKIWNVVAQNCEHSLGGDNPNGDIMAELLKMDLE